MKNYIMLLAITWLIYGCSTHDETYYRTHPKQLQERIMDCPKHSPKGISCQQLTAIAVRLNELGHELRLEPQTYGQKILALQEKEMKLKLQCQNNPNDEEAKTLLKQTQKELQERISVVRWLESPG